MTKHIKMMDDNWGETVFFPHLWKAVCEDVEDANFCMFQGHEHVLQLWGDDYDPGQRRCGDLRSPWEWGEGRTGAFSHGKVMFLWFLDVFGWLFHAFSSPNISQVLAMDRYPEHLVEASVGDVPQLSEITQEIKRLRR